MRFLLMLLFFSVVLCGCSSRDKPDSGFTLETGVSLVSAGECNTSQMGTRPSIKKDNADYLVTIHGGFVCQAELEKPFLSLTREKKATLVIGATQSRFGFSSNCECARSLKIKISERLEPGDTLYILNGTEVSDHVSVP